MEALVEVQRWLFSSLFCLALSLSSVSQKTIPRLVSLSILFLFSCCSPFSSLFSVLPPVFIGSRGRGSPYPLQAQGMVAGAWAF